VKIQPVAGWISFERRLDWELTKRCNLRCAHCISRSFHEHVPDELDADGALRIVDRCVEGGISQVHFFGGEPTTRPDFTALLRRCDELGISTSFNTSGTDLGAPLLETWSALRHRRPAWVSFEDVREHAQDAIRGAGSFHQGRAGAARLAEASGDEGFVVAFTVTRPALAELHPRDVLESFGELGARHVVFQDLAVPRDAPPRLTRLAFDGALWLAFLERLFDPAFNPPLAFTYRLKPLVLEHLNRRLGVELPVPYTGCHAVSTELRLLPGGTVLPCSAAVGWTGALRRFIDETPTLVDLPLDELLALEPYRCFCEHKNVRHVDPRMEPCRACHLAWTKCNPCVFGRMLDEEHTVQTCAWVREAREHEPQT
jgi:MoaA/NifB/PqqE/SkfB family radical SAM enzyme